MGDEFEHALDYCHARGSECKTVCLEDFGHQYMETWQGILEFLQIDNADWPCLLAQDVHSQKSNVEEQHVTSSLITDAQRRDMRELVVKIDREVIGSRLHQLSLKNPCTSTGSQRATAAQSA